MRQDGLEREPEPELFAPYLQQSRIASGHGYQNRVHLNIVVRLTGDADSTVAAIRKIAAELDPTQPLYAVRSMSSVLAEATALRRLHTTLMEIFAGVALFLGRGHLWRDLGERDGKNRRDRVAHSRRRGSPRCVQSVSYAGRQTDFLGSGYRLMLGVAFNRTLSSFLFNTPIYIGNDPGGSAVAP